MPFHQFIRDWEASQSTPATEDDVFLGNTLVAELGNLIQDISPHPATLLDLQFEPQKTTEEGRLWIGRAGHASHLHFDAHDGLLCTVSGRKRVWLYEPLTNQPFIPLLGSTNASEINPAEYEKSEKLRLQFPHFGKATRLEIDILPGELLLIPVRQSIALRVLCAATDLLHLPAGVLVALCRMCRANYCNQLLVVSFR